MNRALTLCALAVAGMIVGWIAIHSSKPSDTRFGSASQPGARSTVVWAAPRALAPTNNAQAPSTPIHPMPDLAMGGPVDSASDDSSTNWQDQVGELLVSDMEDLEKGRRLLELFPSLPLEGQVQLAEQLSFLLGDEDYPALATYLADPSTPPPLLDALLTGVLVRADQVKGPILLSIAENLRHPKAEEARQMLENLVGQELEPDQTQWAAVVRQWIETSSAANAGMEPAEPPQ